MQFYDVYSLLLARRKARIPREWKHSTSMRDWTLSWHRRIEREYNLLHVDHVSGNVYNVSIEGMQPCKLGTITAKTPHVACKSAERLYCNANIKKQVK